MTHTHSKGARFNVLPFETQPSYTHQNRYPPLKFHVDSEFGVVMWHARMPKQAPVQFGFCAALAGASSPITSPSGAGAGRRGGGPWPCLRHCGSTGGVSECIQRFSFEKKNPEIPNQLFDTVSTPNDAEVCLLQGDRMASPRSLAD